MHDPSTEVLEDRLLHATSASETEGARQLHPRVPTGIAGLDHILRGGLPSHRLYVVEGDPGAGKTTLALQFLMEGARRGERGLYITLSETAHELHEVAASHGWFLDGIDLLELDTLAERLNEDANYTIYHPADVELGETVKHIRSEVERLKPARLALDSVSELKILSETNARYRREILALKQFFTGQYCTTLVLDDRTTREEQQLQSIAHGVIRMERQLREYGAVEERHVSTIVIDSLNGYLNAMPSERFLLLQIQELLTYLNQQGVITLLALSQQGMLGQGTHAPVDVSFLADTIVLLRFFEAQGEVRQAISIVKKRRGAHERTIREMRLGPGGVRIGEPLREFEGVLTGVPRYRGKAAPLLTKEDAE